jgi:hypothetical protein
MSNFLKRYAIAIFFPLAYILSWWSILVPQAHGAIIPQGPLLAALILCALTEGRAGLSLWWRRIINWRANWLWYLIAPAIIIIFQIGGGLINLTMGATIHPVNLSKILPSMIMLVFLGGQWEEPGWTAYALPKLQERFPNQPLMATSILAVLRATWHLPLMLSGAITWYNLIFLNLAFQFLISWLYNRTNGSVLIVILFHFTANIIFPITNQAFVGGDSVWFQILFVAVSFVFTLFLIIKAGARLGMQEQTNMELTFPGKIK